MEDHAERPGRETQVSEEEIVGPQRVGLGDALADPGHAVVVSEEVHEAEDHAEGLLHPQEAVEGPLAVELHDRLTVWWVACQPLVGHHMLAGVVAFCWTVPEEDTSLEGWSMSAGYIN